MSNKDIFIKAQNIVIDFPLYESDRSFKKSFFKSITGGVIAKDVKSRLSVKAIDSVNISINAGDRVGLYGHNGSGKTTLLRALTGAFAPSSGFLEVRGSVSSLLDVSMGMDGDATGWENITIRGILMGLSHQEIKDKIEKIGEFTGLGSFLNMPIRTYSSGMHIRLAFAISTIIETDIILLDEWLSVGDSDFQSQAEIRLNQLIEVSPILVLASHSKSLLHSLCNRIIVMEHGRIVDDYKL